MRTLLALKLSVPPCEAAPPAICAATSAKSSDSFDILVNWKVVTAFACPGTTGVVRSATSSTSRLILRSTVKLLDRKSVVSGKSVSVSVDLGGRSIIKKKQHVDRRR